MEELKLCRCGESDMYIESREDFGGPPYFARCFNCDSEGPDATTVEAAISAWNRRVSNKGKSDD